jgi:hypothetical protein
MKLRTDFVTNSSSSSFVIAYKDFPKLEEDVIKRYPFLDNINELIEKILFSEGGSYDETTEGVVCKDKKSFDDYFIGRYGGSQDTLETLFANSPYCKEDYEKIVEYVNKGYKILFKYIDYSDDTLTSMIKWLSDMNKEYFVILEED